MLLGHVVNTVFRFVQLVLIVMVFTAPEQGVFFTIFSVLQLQQLFELGIGPAMQQLASLDAAGLTRLESGQLTGDPVALRRLAGLFRYAIRWYAWMSIAFAVVIGAVGFLFLSSVADIQDISWQGAWLSAAAVAAIALFVSSVVLFLGGCGRIAAMSQLFVFQSVVAGAIFCVVALSGGRLMALPFSVGGGAAVVVLMLIVRERDLFRQLRCTADVAADTPHGVWKFQWRMAVSYASGALMSYLMVPMTLAYLGPIASGQLGMTFTALSILQTMAFSWMNSRVPEFGRLIACADWQRLDALFAKALLRSMGFAVLTTFAFLAGIWMMDAGVIPERISQYRYRFLPLLPSMLIAGGLLANSYGGCLALYLRCHGQEPLVLVSVASSLLVVASQWWFLRQGSLPGLAAALCSCSVASSMGIVTWIFADRRRRWHAPEERRVGD